MPAGVIFDLSDCFFFPDFLDTENYYAYLISYEEELSYQVPLRFHSASILFDANSETNMMDEDRKDNESVEILEGLDQRHGDF